MSAEIPKNYNTKEIEKKWQIFWEKERIYQFNPDSSAPVFSVDTPPPYLSADHLHAGHVMSYTQAEIIIRYHRMKGENIFYPMGFDDNGLPTERFVEKKYNINKSKTTRKEFTDLCLKETAAGGKVYEKFWKSLGLSVDWSLLYSTIDSRSQKTAQRSFLDLFRKGRIYREDAPVFWCTACQTALAQADLEDKEEKSFMRDVKFSLENGDEVVISTTRPELIPACVALYVHPDDERYRKIAGQNAIVPLVNEKVSVRTSPLVDREKGTGLMMVCTWGDVEDVQKWKEDKLPTKLIIGKDGRFNEKAGKYAGLKLREAREAVVRDLEDQNLIVGSREITHVLNIHERCKNPVDFYASPQWFIKILDLKDDLKKRGEEIKWHPSFMKIHLDNWIDGLKWDWCISRDRYYGVPFPVWYCAGCEEIILPEDDELPVDPRESPPRNGSCPRCGESKIKGEMQVMDTWMTSSVTPLINARWQDRKNLMKEIYPMTLRVQAFEIIRTWLFYTLVKSHLHTKTAPWREVMISGWGLGNDGQKMSKSLNNFVAAGAIIEKYSADALRFWACGAMLGMNLRFSEEDVRAGQKILTKLWNAARFIAMNTENMNRKANLSPKNLNSADRWILSELQKLVRSVAEQLDNYEFAKAKILLEQFFWIKFADNYIELIKGRLYGEDAEKKYSAQFALFKTLSALVHLFAPFLPHLTEELYQCFIRNSASPVSVHISPWPEVDGDFDDEKMRKNGKKLMEVIAAIRKIKAEKGVKLSENITALTVGARGLDESFFSNAASDLQNVARANAISFDWQSEKTVDFST